MITFENGIDSRSRIYVVPTVARFHVSNGAYRFCVIGTAYGHIHTSAGDVRTWQTISGARRAAKAYLPL